jgi:hypothetical protein
LPPRPAAATVAAEFFRSDLRDVTAAMMTSLWMLRGRRGAGAFLGVFEEPLAESTRPSDRPMQPVPSPGKRFFVMAITSFN